MPTLEEVIAFLSTQKVRATYGAVAGALGLVERSLGAQLGPRRKEASWIVAKRNGLPTGYSIEERDEALLLNPTVIESVAELLMRMGASPEVAADAARSDAARRAHQTRRNDARVNCARRTAR